MQTNKRYQFKYLQVYLPTTSYPDEDIEKVYKVIWQKMKEDICKHDETQIIEVIENSKSNKQDRGSA